MNFSTWEELQDSYCSNPVENNYYEEFSNRRYNPSPQDDRTACRLVFLRKVTENPTNRTLHRKGRFLWCRNLQYEGVGNDGLRHVSFTVDSGKKRFKIAENNILSVPAKAYVHNNRYFRSKEKTFFPFSTVFGYDKALKMMAYGGGYDKSDLRDLVSHDCPYKPGTLVVPRKGYFYPMVTPPHKAPLSLQAEHPCGIILGRAFIDDYMGREFYRVRYGETTYERVHPVQMEIINEV